MILAELREDTNAQVNKNHILLKLANADSYSLRIPVEQAIAILIDPDANRPPKTIAGLDIGHPTAYKIQNKLTDLLTIRVDMDLKAALSTVLELYFLGLLTPNYALPTSYKVSTQAYIILATTVSTEPIDQLIIRLTRDTPIPQAPIFLNHARPKALQLKLPQPTYDKLVQIGNLIFTDHAATSQDAALDYILINSSPQ